MSLAEGEACRLDEPRWLASRFAPAAARPHLAALIWTWAEISRIPLAVREPHLGLMRLVWWRDAIEALLAGAAFPPHPPLLALQAAHAATPLAPALFERMFAARGTADFEAAPFVDWSNIYEYFDATIGGLIRLNATACGVRDFATAPLARFAGLVELAVNYERLKAQGRCWLPHTMMRSLGVADHFALFAAPQAEAQAKAALINAAKAALPAANAAARAAPTSAWPAFLDLAATHTRLRRFSRNAAAAVAQPGPFTLRLNLLLAMLRQRL